MNNCGACGVLCTGGTICASGKCVCPQNTTACGNPPQCINTTSDPQNCGACAKACAAGLVCNTGMCACPGGLMDCSGDAASDAGLLVCINPRTDRDNCGGCGVHCDGGRCQNATCN